MTHGEWLACAAPDKMIKFLRGKAKYARKFQLFVCAIVAPAWPFLARDPERQALAAAARFVEGTATRDELWSAFRAVDPYARYSGPAVMYSPLGLLHDAVSAPGWQSALAAARAV